ncbi:MAG: hypothetical protein NWE76_09645 [Candidatus Bathyarchaeota archaeon]|nr:hypothetical protein [Candidatus Bathyarchaeota archaeon]
MKATWLRIGGILLVAASVFLLLPNAQQGFKPFEGVIFPINDSLVSTEIDIADALSYALWEKRPLDVIFLGLLLFLTSACCATMLGPKGDMKK